MNPSFDLLTEPLITVQTAAGERSVTLPGLLAALSAGDEIQGFPALQPHQKHAWYAFLVQLAALVRARVGDPGTDEAAWREHVLILGEHPTAFALVVPDLTQPGFLQPPVKASDLKGEIATPDALDLPVVTKVHDVKATRLVAPRPEHWLFALLNQQTMEGYSGRANYGVARMNGGLSNRPGFGLAAGPGLAPRFRRDLDIVLATRDTLVGSHGYDPYGPALLWTLPWTNDTSLVPRQCDPFFIEICRRVRLTLAGDRLFARNGPSNAPRVEAKEIKGVLGDAWTPILKEEAKSLTVDGRGITWQLLQRLLLTNEFAPGAAQERTDSDPDRMWLSAWALVRGQGKTEGLHERWLELPAHIADFSRQPEAWQQVMLMSQARVEQFKKMKDKVLVPALLRLVVDPNQKALPSEHDGYLKRHTERLEAWVDAHFFPLLWESAGRTDATRDLAWQRALWIETERIFRQAAEETPLPAPRRYARLSRGHGLLRGCLRKQFPDLAETLREAPQPVETEGVSP